MDTFELRLYGGGGFFRLKLPSLDLESTFALIMAFRHLPIALYWNMRDNIIHIRRGGMYYSEIEAITEARGLSRPRYFKMAKK